MILEALFAVLSFVLEAILDTIPDAEAPEWMGQGGTALSVAVQFGHSMGVWLPWNMLGVVVGAQLGSHLIGFGIKAARMVLSLFTAGGGSAA